MRKLKFLLINPTHPRWRIEKDGHSRFPRVFRFSMLTSLSVAAAMPANVETQIIDEDVEPVDFDTEADLVGISFMTFNAPRAYEIADIFRKKKKPVVFGGYHPSFMPEEAVEHADAVCVGEAEKNAPVMIQDYMEGRLRPLYKGWCENLQGLSIPDRTLIRKSAYIEADVMQATRGCPYKCRFCSVAAFNRYRFRIRPIDEVLMELGSLGKNVIFMDDNIVGNADYARELFAKMIPLKKHWFSQCSIRIAYDDELLKLAADSGCSGLFIGFESLSQDNLDAVKKNFNRAEDYIRIVQKIHSVGIAVFAGFAFGLDCDKPSIFEKTLDFLDRAKIDSLQATNWTPFPGTPLFEEMDSQGRIFDKDWSHYDFAHVVFEPSHMSPRMLKTGTDWVQSQFYSRKSISRRLWRAFGYLPPWLVLKAVAPLNFSYRIRHRACGTFERGKSHHAPTSLQPNSGRGLMRRSEKRY
jgi:radical SAM superfamily enzyme YgiQ (UPF0313 family)